MIKYLVLAIKGMGMGAADVVPGVSGGTIAFMTGIYEELIFSLKSIDHKAVTYFFKGQFKQFWSHINGFFLLSVFSGILLSIFTLARVMQYLLINHPIPLWSFFFGLITASAIFILREIGNWKFTHLLSLLTGIVIAAWISFVTPGETTDARWFVFISGMVAICAMILPGISGSFILLLMGKYAFMMQAVKEFNIPVIAIFAFGAVIGLIAFSHILSWLLKKYYKVTVTLLAGFMGGSLIKVWPWKVDSTLFEGLFKPVLPSTFEAATGHQPLLFYSIISMIIGFALVFVIEFLAKAMHK